MEADSLADTIKRLLAAGTSPNSITVFYRMQKQSAVLEDVFSRCGIPYQNTVRKTIKDFPVLRWLIRLLRAGVNPNDHASLSAALTDQKYGPGLTTAQLKKITAGCCDLYGRILGFPDWAKQGSSAGVYEYFGLEECL
jgi:DNA helicase-2/ATP-dependent DNA helicase PcrA